MMSPLFCIKGGSSAMSLVRLSVVIKGRMFGPRERLNLSSSLWYHILIAVKSLMLSPALGWMLCMVAATTVFKFSLVTRDSNNFDNFAASIKI